MPRGQNLGRVGTAVAVARGTPCAGRPRRSARAATGTQCGGKTVDLLAHDLFHIPLPPGAGQPVEPSGHAHHTTGGEDLVLEPPALLRRWRGPTISCPDVEPVGFLSNNRTATAERVVAGGDIENVEHCRQDRQAQAEQVVADVEVQHNGDHQGGDPRHARDHPEHRA